MKSQNRLGKARVYHNFGSAFGKFKKLDKFKLADIDYNFLKSYEKYLFKNGSTGGGVHNYMRILRAIVNEGLRRKFMAKDDYPFKGQFNPNGYSLSHLKSNASPRALTQMDIEKIKAFPLENHPELVFAWKVFMFTYYAFGINFADIASLKKSDIQGGRINYVRAKTGRHYSVPIKKEMADIISEMQRQDSEYLFPIFTEGVHITAQQKFNRRHKILKQVNDALKEIAQILGIEASLTTYVARHTFATMLKEKDVNIALISEALGHKELSTTQAYLKKFDQGRLDDLGALL